MKPIIAARRLAAGLGAALLALAVMHPARAAYPDRPIRMVVPFPPGSITDVVARSLGKAMADDLGQPVVVENKPGANGIIGTHDVARSKPDGYTVVVVGVSTAASGVSLFKNLPYDPAVDLSPIGAVAETPHSLVGSAAPAGRQRGRAVRLRRAASGQADLCLRLGQRAGVRRRGRGWVASTSRPCPIAAARRR